MEPRVVKPPGQDLVVESLKSRYGLGGSCPDEYDFSNFYQSKRRTLTSPGDLDVYSGDKVGSSLKYSDESKHCRTPLGSLFKHVNVNCLDDELDSFHDLKKQETEEELIENDYRVSTSKITKQSFKEIEKVALPTNTTSSRPRTECCSDAGDSPLKPVSCPKSKASDKRSLLPHQISQIHDELFQIHLKLQQHDAEVEHLTEVLKEKNKETKRLRSSFDALKELNDTLKKQLNEASEENRKIDIQAKRVQARLDNLQRKYEFMTIQRLKGSSHAVHEMKSLKQEKAPVSKTYKVPLNGQVYELVTVFMDWISDHHLSKVKHEESGMDEPPLWHAEFSKEELVQKLSSTTESADHLNGLLRETEATNAVLMKQIKLLKSEIRRLERNQEREESAANVEHLKNVLLQFIFLKPGSERERLLPGIDTMLQLSPEEKGKLAAVAQGEE
nr:coiled-coil domain-containing protein 138-like isoform X5 [Gorilla gorilla gorilla]